MYRSWFLFLLFLFEVFPAQSKYSLIICNLLKLVSERSYLFLLISFLTMFFGEGLIMSSPLWFFNPWSLLITLPLYAFHLVFLLTLAIKTERTSLRQLYLWGVFFGLYESWITKVLWHGYGSDQPIWGLYSGIALFEFLTLLFFYHPFYSFIVPILVFELFAFQSSFDETSNTFLLVFTASRYSMTTATPCLQLKP